MSHRDIALLLFLPLSNSECPGLSQLIKLKWWGHELYLYNLYSVIFPITAL